MTPTDIVLHGPALLKALVYLARHTQRKAWPKIMRAADRIFQHQVQRVIQRVHDPSKAAKYEGGPTSITLALPQHEAIWMQAIQDVFEAAGLDMDLTLVPPVREVLDQGHSKTATLFGLDIRPQDSAQVAAAARQIASKITRINDTTRQKFADVIRAAIAEGLTVAETAARLRETMTAFNRSRLATIARTETMMAWTQGSVAAMRESGQITHVSVIGCESREYDRWGHPSFQQFMYRGEGTCNIQDVPVEDAAGLQFHPNHTGVMVPSRFVDGRSSLGHG